VGGGVGAGVGAGVGSGTGAGAGVAAGSPPSARCTSLRFTVSSLFAAWWIASFRMSWYSAMV
jgi:hypothetical protein